MNLSSPWQINSAFSQIDFTSRKLSTLEGVLWAGRTALTKGNSSRSVILFFVSAMNDTLEPKNMVGVRSACAAVRNAYVWHKAARLVVVTASKDARTKFAQLQCATPWGEQAGYISLDEINKSNKSTALEEQFIYAFTQESTTRDVRSQEERARPE